MFSRKWNVLALGAAMFAAGFGVRGFVGGEVAHAQAATRVFEMRTYTAGPGKFAALHSRFRDHTLRLFEKHGMQNIGYWVPADPPNSENTLTYIIAHKDREAAKRAGRRLAPIRSGRRCARNRWRTGSASQRKSSRCS